MLTSQEPTTIELSYQEVEDLLKALEVQGSVTKVKGNSASYRRWYDLRDRLQSERYKWK
jgi:hypothetical protein